MLQRRSRARGKRWAVAVTLSNIRGRAAPVGPELRGPTTERDNLQHTPAATDPLGQFKAAFEMTWLTFDRNSVTDTAQQLKKLERNT
jgi:hypothetical protein